MQLVRNYKPNPEQERNYRVALFITMGGNLALAVAKGVVAFISGSAALYADAFCPILHPLGFCRREWKHDAQCECQCKYN